MEARPRDDCLVELEAAGSEGYTLVAVVLRSGKPGPRGKQRSGARRKASSAAERRESDRLEPTDGELHYGTVAAAAETADVVFPLLVLVDHLLARGATWLDCQVMTAHMRALGAREISRTKFLDMLAEAQAKGTSLF